MISQKCRTLLPLLNGALFPLFLFSLRCLKSQFITISLFSSHVINFLISYSPVVARVIVPSSRLQIIFAWVWNTSSIVLLLLDVSNAFGIISTYFLYCFVPVEYLHQWLIIFEVTCLCDGGAFAAKIYSHSGVMLLLYTAMWRLISSSICIF